VIFWERIASMTRVYNLAQEFKINYFLLILNNCSEFI